MSSIAKIFRVVVRGVFLYVLSYIFIVFFSAGATRSAPAFPYSAVRSAKINYAIITKSFFKEKSRAIHYRLQYTKVSDSGEATVLWMKRDIASDFIIIGDTLYEIPHDERKVVVPQWTYRNHIDFLQTSLWRFSFGIYDNFSELFDSINCNTFYDPILGLRKASCFIIPDNKEMDSVQVNYSFTFPLCSGSSFEKIVWAFSNYQREMQMCDSGVYSSNIDSELIINARNYIQRLRDSGYLFITPSNERNRIENVPKIGADFPIRYLRDTDGKQFDLFANDSQLILLDFWHMSCYPCILSIPAISGLYKKYKDLGVLIIGVNPYDEERHESLKRFYASYKPSYRSYFIDREQFAQSGIESFPTFFLIKGRKIMDVKTGFGSNLEPMLDSLLQKGHPTK